MRAFACNGGSCRHLLFKQMSAIAQQERFCFVRGKQSCSSLRQLCGRLAPLFASGTRDKVKEPPRVSSAAALLHLRLPAYLFYLFSNCLSIGRFKIPPRFLVCGVLGKQICGTCAPFPLGERAGGMGGYCTALHFAKLSFVQLRRGGARVLRRSFSCAAAPPPWRSCEPFRLGRSLRRR